MDFIENVERDFPNGFAGFEEHLPAMLEWRDPKDPNEQRDVTRRHLEPRVTAA